MGALVDLDRPVDFALSDLDSTEATPKFAGAAVLVDPVAAGETLDKYFKSKQTAPGVVRLEPRDDAPDGATPRPCMLAPSVGGTTRIVCGDDADSVRHLGPYIARTMARLSSSDDLRVEFFVRQFHIPKSGVTRELGPGGGIVVDAGPGDPNDKLFDTLTEKLTDDVGSVVLEASTDGTTADVRMTTGFVAAASALSRALVGLGAPQPAPPPAFDRLPRDASFAWYGRGATPADLAPLKSAVFEDFHAWLEDDGYQSSVVDTMLAPLQQLFFTGGPWVVASGSRMDTARAALDAYVDAGKTTDAARAKARAATQGWVLAAVEEPPQKWIDGIRELVKYDALKPTGKARRKHDPQKDSTKLVVTPVPAALQLPAGALHVEARVTQNQAWLAAQAKAKTKVKDPVLPHTAHFFVVPDGGRTWFAEAEDASLAAEEVRAAIAAAPGAGLASRHDLDALRTMSASSAGFLSVASLATWLTSSSSDQGLRRARETLAGLASLTNGGATPIPVALSSTPNAGGAGDVKLRVLFPIQIAVEIAASPHSIF